MELAKLDVSDTTDMNANILQSLIWLYGDREEYQSVEAFNAHLDAVSAVKQQQDEEMKTAFFSGPAPDWVGDLTADAWKIIFEILDKISPPSGATNLYLALICCKKLMQSEIGAYVRTMLDDKDIIFNASIWPNGESPERRLNQVAELCETVPTARLDLFGSELLSDSVLQRPLFRELEMNKLRELHCGIEDLSLLQNFNCLEELELIASAPKFPAHLRKLGPEQLQVLATLPKLRILKFLDYLEVLLNGLEFPSLCKLGIHLDKNDGSEEQEEFKFQLPVTPIKLLELFGPTETEAAEVDGYNKFPIPLDLMAAADRCEHITIFSMSLAFIDATEQYSGYPYDYVRDALRHGKAWKSIQIYLFELTERVAISDGESYSVFSSEMDLRSGNDFDGFNINTLKDLLLEELGPRGVVELKAPVNVGDAEHLLIFRDIKYMRKASET